MRAPPRARVARRLRPAILQAPPQGASSLVVYLVMLLVVGVAVADARRLVAPASGETAGIPVLMVAAGLIGFVLARSSLGILRAHLLGAAVGTCLILLSVAARVVGAPHALALDAAVVSQRVEALWVEIVRLSAAGADAGLQERWPLALLVLAAICWTTGQFGAFSLFRYDRAAPAVVASGLLLLLNVSFPNAYAGLPILWSIIPFAVLALLLVMRLHLGHQQAEWARRHIADARDVSGRFLRTGVAFVLVAALGASTLTVVAVSDRSGLPLPEVGGPLDDFREQLLDLLSGLGIVVPAGQVPEAELGDRQEIPEAWEMGEGIRFRATSDRAATTYWWGAAYASFDGRAWTPGPTRRRGVEPGAAIPAGGLEVPGRGGAQEHRAQVSAQITPVGFAMARLLAPATAVRADDRALAALVGDPGGARVRVDIEAPVGRGESYAVVSLVLGDEGAPAPLTADHLRAASIAYPEGLDAYLEVPDRASGPRTRRFAAGIEAAVRGRPSDNPYDKAFLVQTALRDEFRYEPRMDGVCGDLPASECLFEAEMGFCVHYATAMAIALREMGIPTRAVYGYLPGDVVGPTEVEVPRQAAHAWVEVFFPGYGWVRFDPTPSLEALGGQPTELPEDDPDSEGEGPDRDPTPTFEPADPEPEPTPDPEASPEAGVGADAGGSGGADLAGLLVAMLVGLAAVGLGLLGSAIIALRRLPTLDPEAAYRGVVSLATRLGHGPSPSQTSNEYLGSLAEALPVVRHDLEVVAHARVESAYARRLGDADALAALRRAYARTRTALLRLILRR
jgi:transglutaminase-like putative cysteine protease